MRLSSPCGTPEQAAPFRFLCNPFALASLCLRIAVRARRKRGGNPETGHWRRDSVRQYGYKRARMRRIGAQGQAMTQTVICMKWGTRYGPDYVNRLYSMI